MAPGEGPAKGAPLILVSIFFLLVQTWAAFRPCVINDEEHYFFSARQINSGGDWLTPVDQYGRLRLHKPPLYSWLTALVFKITGPRIAALRAVSILAGLLAGWALYLLAGLLFGSREAALTAGAAMLGFTEFNLISGQGRPDTLLILFLITANYCLARVVLGRPRPVLFTLLGFLSAGLGFMSKGPFALLHTLLLPLITALVHKELRPNLRYLLNPLAWLILLGVIGPWYAALLSRHGPEIWPQFLGDISRNGPGLELPLIVLGNLTVFLNRGLVIALPWWPLLFLYLASRSDPAVSVRRRARRPSLTYVWAWLILAFVSLLPNKSNYSRYLMVVFPALGLIAAYFAASALQAPGWVRKWALPLYLGVLGSIYLVWAGLLGTAHFLYGARLSDPGHLLLPAAAVMLGLVLLTAFQWRRGNLAGALAAMACLSIAANGTYARDLSPSADQVAVARLAGEVLSRYDPAQTRVYDLGLAKEEWPLVVDGSGHIPAGRFTRRGNEVAAPKGGFPRPGKEEEVLFVAHGRKFERQPLEFRQRFRLLDRRKGVFLKVGGGRFLSLGTDTALLLGLETEAGGLKP